MSEARSTPTASDITDFQQRRVRALVDWVAAHRDADTFIKLRWRQDGTALLANLYVSLCDPNEVAVDGQSLNSSWGFSHPDPWADGLPDTTIEEFSASPDPWHHQNCVAAYKALLSGIDRLGITLADTDLDLTSVNAHNHGRASCHEKLHILTGAALDVLREEGLRRWGMSLAATHEDAT